jgi:hypothetical protein
MSWVRTAQTARASPQIRERTGARRQLSPYLCPHRAGQLPPASRRCGPRLVACHRARTARSSSHGGDVGSVPDLARRRSSRLTGFVPALLSADSWQTDRSGVWILRSPLTSRGPRRRRRPVSSGVRQPVWKCMWTSVPPWSVGEVMST